MLKVLQSGGLLKYFMRNNYCYQLIYLNFSKFVKGFAIRYTVFISILCVKKILIKHVIFKVRRNRWLNYIMTTSLPEKRRIFYLRMFQYLSPPMSNLYCYVDTEEFIQGGCRKTRSTRGKMHLNNVSANTSRTHIATNKLLSIIGPN